MDRRGEAGFSLIEVMAALAVFSIAAIALLHASAENARAAVRLEETALSRIIAQNIMVETFVANPKPGQGAESGETEMAGTRWAWRREIAPTPDPDVFRVTIEVRQSADGPVSSQLTGFITS